MSGDSVVQRVVRGETSRRSSSREKGAVCFRYDRDGERTHVRIARDIEPHHSDAITTSEPDGRAYEDALPEYPLPGSGAERWDCGQRFHGNFCTGCGKPHEVGRTCGSPECPRCWQSWAFHRGIDMAAKLHDLAKKVNHQTFKHHVTVSLRDSTRFNSKNPLKQGIEAIKPLLETVNVKTGYLVYHPYRIAPEYRGDVLGHESGDGDMTWKDVLAKVESEDWCWEAIVSEFLVYSPHFHVLCLSNFVDTTDQDGPGVGDIEAETGVVIHRITQTREDGKERSIADLGELCKATAYSLSHTAIAPESERQTHRAAVRAFGQVANHDVPDKAPSRQEVTEAMRSVAGKVLGISFSKPECHAPVPVERDRDTDTGSDGPGADYLNATQHLSGGGSGIADATPDGFGSDGFGPFNDDTGSWDATQGSVPSGLEVVTGDQSEECNGRLAPIWKAEVYLGRLGWIKEIEATHGERRLHELRHAIEEWRDMGSPHPEEVVPADE